jgi:HTH-type transcriptional regulator/antitoxin HigA
MGSGKSWWGNLTAKSAKDAKEEKEKMAFFSDEILASWKIISSLLIIRNDNEYDAAVARMNELLDEIGADESHPLYSLLDTLGTLIQIYEEEHHPIP